MNLIWVAAALGLAFAARSVAAEPAVRAWQGSMSLPTWEQGLADPIPHFPVLGADHAWYPYASRAEPGKESRNQTWRTLNLENEFLVCVVLPDLGGRLYSCRDKLSGYDLFYANPAAKKSALGVEINFPVLNFPMHNGPRTMSPVDFQIVQNADSASVWVGGTDRITGMRWRVEFALERGWAALRQSVRVDNPTAVRHGYAWWTNATVKLDDDTRVIDGLPGVYHPRAQTGTLHYADAAEMPDRNIVRATDNVALGAGVHGLLDPAASSTFTEYWIPVRKMAGISQAGRDGVLFLARENGALKAQLLSTRSIAGAKVRIVCGARTLAEESIAFDAAKPWERTIGDAPAGPCKLRLQDAAGHALIECAEGEAKADPPPAIPALDSAGQFELQGEMARASDELRKARAKDPASVPLRKASGRLATVMQRFEEALSQLSSAGDAEAHYYRGVAFAGLGSDEEALREWSQARADAHFGIAAATETAAAVARAGDAQHAAGELSGAGVRLVRALVMQAALARAAGDTAAAKTAVTRAAALDAADPAVRFELVRQGAADAPLWDHLAADPERVLEIADLYMHWGRYKDALEALMYRYPPVSGSRREPGAAAPQDYAMLAYYRGYCHQKLNEFAAEDFRTGSSLPVRYVFPSRPAERRVLEAAIQASAGDANAHYLLGLWYLNAQQVLEGRRELQAAQKLRPEMAEARALLTAMNAPMVPIPGAAPVPKAAPKPAPPPKTVAPSPAPAPATPVPATPGSVVPAPAPPAESSPLASVPGWFSGKPGDVANSALDAAAAGDVPRALTYFNRGNFPTVRQPDSVRWAYLEVQLQRVFELAYAGNCAEVVQGIQQLGSDNKALPFTSASFGELMKGARFQFEIGLLEVACVGDKEARRRWEKVSKLRVPLTSPDFAYPYLALSKLGPIGGLGLVIQQIEAAMATAPPADQPALIYSRGLVLWALGKKDEAGAAFRQGAEKAPAGMLRYLNQNALRALARAKE